MVAPAVEMMPVTPADKSNVLLLNDNAAGKTALEIQCNRTVSADLQEFIDNTEILSTETVSCEELGKNVKKITFRSTCNGKTITMLTNGYISNANVSQESA